MGFYGLFNPENRFWSFMEKIMNLCLLGLLWAICSLPVLTAGAATAALFQYTLRLARNEEGYVCRTFFRGFCSCFVQATLLWLGILAAGLFLAVDLFCCQFLPFSGMIRWMIRGLLASLLLLLFLTAVYVFPLIALFRVPSRKALPDALIMAVGNLWPSVVILMIYGLFAAASWFLPLLFMVWFALAGYAASLILRRVFDRYADAEEKQAG